MKIQLKNWSYVIKQDLETGQLDILEVRKVGAVEKAISYAKAEASAFVSSTPLPQIMDRKAVCSSCDGCKKVDDETWYCKNCGCPEWERSRLQVKWEMPAATCPLGKWTGNI